MTRNSAAYALSLALLSAASLSCDRITAPSTTGALTVALTTEALDSVRVTVSGATTKSVTERVIPGVAANVRFEGLLAGSYEVTVEGLVDSLVAQYGLTSAVNVAAGQTTMPPVTLSLFQPVVTNFADADTVNVLHFTVEYSAVSHATSYIIDWSSSHTFATVSSDTVTGTSAEIVVPEEGRYYFAVRAANATVTAGGLPSSMQTVYALQTVATVTVLPATPSIVDGTTQQFTAVARDPENNVLSGITFFWNSSNNAAATVTQTGLVTSVNPGQATISAVAKGVPGNATITVTPQAPTKLVFTAEPTNTVAGATISSIKVAIQNPKNQTAASDNTTQITLAITNPGGAVLGGTAIATVANGVATFANLNVNKTGTNYTFTATATSLTSATSGQFNITPGAATTLAFSVQPTNTTAGAPFAAAVEVEIRDGLGNRVTTARDAITIALGANPGSGTLSGTKVVNAIDGVATFAGLSVDKVASGYSLTANGASLPQVTSANFRISALGVATKLVFDALVNSSSATLDISATVSARDGFGNVVDVAVPVTLSLGANPAGGALTGSTQATTVAGVATIGAFNIRKAGTGYRLVATSGSLNPATSDLLVITAGLSTQLAFTTQPTSSEPQGPLGTIAVALQDQYGNQTAAGQDVTVGINDNPGGGTLTGTFTVMSSNGLATFSDLVIDNDGSGYTLIATSAGVTDAISSPFDVFLQFASISAAEWFSCGVTTRGSAYCWGDNDANGRLGNGDDENIYPTPQRVLGGHTFKMLSTGFVHVCGIRQTDNAALCWGNAALGKMGNGVETGIFNTPQLVSGGHAFLTLSAAEFHTCGIRASDNAALCWGDAEFGKLGIDAGILDGTFSEPQLVADGHSFRDITSALTHTCAVRTDGVAYCWGLADAGRLGNNDLTPVGYGTPQLVAGGMTYKRISARTDHTCAIRAIDDRAWCWGQAQNGKLGNNTTIPDLAAPAPVSNLIRYSDIAAGDESTCAVGLNGGAFCWGLGSDGQLGNGSLGQVSTPVTVAGGLQFIQISSGVSFGRHACGVTTSGAFCWGRNANSELGDGSSFNSSVPVRVKGSR